MKIPEFNIVTYLKTLLISLIAFVSPIYGLLLAVGAMIFLDTILGVTKAIKLEGWESVTSRKASVIISKFLLYQLTVLTFFIIDYNLINEFTKLHYQNNYLLTKLITALTDLLFDLSGPKFQLLLIKFFFLCSSINNKR